MKKLLVCLAAAFMVFSASAAEKGDMSVGLSLGVAPNLANANDLWAIDAPGLEEYIMTKAPGTNFMVALKFDYNFTDKIRLEAGVENYVRKNDHSMIDIYVNGHYLFDVMDKLQVYPLVGIGYGREAVYYHTPTTPSGTHESMNRFIVNVGAGADYQLSDRLAANVELRYMYVCHFDKFPISVGLRYKF